MIDQAAEWLRQARYVTVFTGAGLSVGAGIAQFEQTAGFDLNALVLDYFMAHPQTSWKIIKTYIYDSFAKAKPSQGHHILARWEEQKRIRSVVTLNMDGLHQIAGSQQVVEMCGTPARLKCLACGMEHAAESFNLDVLPPICPACGGVLKPDIQFYGEMVPNAVNRKALKEANRASVLLVVGVSGQMMPAGLIPFFARRHRGQKVKIIEINIQPTRYTSDVTDLFIQQDAQEVLRALDQLW